MRIYVNASMREAGGLICNLDHREADDLFADEEALLEDLGDHILAQTLLLDVHHGVVPRGIKDFSDLAEARHAQTLHDLHQLVHGHFDALLVRLVGGFLRERTLEIVVDRQELADGLGFDDGVKIIFFLLAALAEIVIFRRQTKVAVMLLCKLLLDAVQLRRLFFFLCRFFCGLLRRRGKKLAADRQAL